MGDEQIDDAIELLIEKKGKYVGQGDMAKFDPAIKVLSEKTGKPVTK